MADGYYIPRYQQRQSGGGGNGLLQLLSLFAKGQGVQEAGTIPGQTYTVDGQEFTTPDLPLMRAKPSNWLGRVFGNAEQGEQAAQAANLSARIMQAEQQSEYQRMLADLTGRRTDAATQRTFQSGEADKTRAFETEQRLAKQRFDENSAIDARTGELNRIMAQQLGNSGIYFSPEQLPGTVQDARARLNEPTFARMGAETAAATQKSLAAKEADLTNTLATRQTREQVLANALAKEKLAGGKLENAQQLLPSELSAEQMQNKLRSMGVMSAPLGSDIIGFHPGDGTPFRIVGGLSAADSKGQFTIDPVTGMPSRQSAQRYFSGKNKVSEILGPDGNGPIVTNEGPAAVAAPEPMRQPVPAPVAAPVAAPQEQRPAAPYRETLYKQLAELAKKNTRFGGASLKTGLTQPSSTLFKPASLSMEKMLADLNEIEQGKRATLGYPVKLPAQDVEAMRNIIAALLRKEIPANPAYQ